MNNDTFPVDLTSTNEIKRTSNMETYLHALYKATNYTIKVLAFTSAGDGIPSIPVYCTTDDDGNIIIMKILFSETVFIQPLVFTFALLILFGISILIQCQNRQLI